MKKISLLFLTASTFCMAQTVQLEQKITEIIRNKKATVGVSVTNFNNQKQVHINGNKMLPMLSVFKFHIALAILDLVDQGKLKLDQEILIKKSNYQENTWSPIAKKYPEGNINMSLKELLDYVVAQSDNNGTDLLLKMIGGPTIVQKYINSKGIKDFIIKADEAKMHEGYEFMYWNITSSQSANKALEEFYNGKMLSKNSTQVLLDIMKNTSTGANKIVALLPKGTFVAHKTGSSGKDTTGKTIAENDIAIIKTPNGTPYALSIFVSDSMESEETNNKMIAEISKVVWDDFNK